MVGTFEKDLFWIIPVFVKRNMIIGTEADKKVGEYRKDRDCLVTDLFKGDLMPK